MQTYVCTHCGATQTRPTLPLRCPACGQQRIGLFKPQAQPPAAQAPAAPAPAAQPTAPAPTSKPPSAQPSASPAARRLSRRRLSNRASPHCGPLSVRNRRLWPRRRHCPRQPRRRRRLRAGRLRGARPLRSGLPASPAQSPGAGRSDCLGRTTRFCRCAIVRRWGARSSSMLRWGVTWSRSPKSRTPSTWFGSMPLAVTSPVRPCSGPTCGFAFTPVTAGCTA